MKRFQVSPTPRQADCLAILTREATRGNCPTGRQIAAEMGIQHSCVIAFLKALEERGHIRRHRHRPFIELCGSFTAHRVIDGTRMRFIPVHTAPDGLCCAVAA